MLRGKPNKRYTPEFKKLVVETMMKEKLGYRETARRFEVRGAQQIINWERIYLAEGPEALAIERRQHKTLVVQKLRKKIFSQSSAFHHSTAPCNVLLSLETNAENRQIYIC